MDILPVTLELAYVRLKNFPADSHKGTFGHAVIVGGSYGKIGAVILSLRAALKSGCGLASCFIPECGYTAVQAAVPEAMVVTDVNERQISQIAVGFEPSAVGIGPGMGKDFVTKKAFHRFLKTSDVPLVVDADAINILSENKSWLALLAEGTVLTPHPVELERLIGRYKSEDSRVKATQELAASHKLVIVMKGAPSKIVTANEIFENTSGNLALATAGSGDVLTGIITSLLAQGYNPTDAAVFGVYLHGLTADIALPQTGRQSFVASDIIDHIGKAYLAIESFSPNP